MRLLFLIILPLLALTCTRAPRFPAPTEPDQIAVGGGCDGCDLMFSEMPKTINAVDTSAGWNEKGRKLIIKGTVFRLDGKTPAPNVIIYYWQTDHNGLYSKGKTKTASTNHGYIRGWMKTAADGKYTLHTIRPASYPEGNNPEHIHIAIKEPGKTVYYIDEFTFDDDPLLDDNNRGRMENRGGNGILKPTKFNDLQTAEHVIILGKNIPDYPKQ